MDYEKSLKKLEHILSKIEKNVLPLDELILLYEKGNKIANECQAKIDLAEQKIKIISNNK